MSEAAVWAAIILVAVVTLASRVIGPPIMNRVGPSRRVERFLDGLSVSVVAALVASIVAQGGLREATAVLIAALVMLASRSAVWAMIAGMVVAAGWTAAMNS